ASAVARLTALGQGDLSTLHVAADAVVYMEMAAGDTTVGSTPSAPVHPRLVAKQALDLNAAAVIVAHNHPSGEIEPSRQDIDLTKRLKEALNLVDVNLLDHLIIGSVNSFSFVERCYL
ncbi:MAG: hypothetical protein LM522_06735, partial [Candidatus Contendobacter sp.]|nr:hypothetical protein [Candidatus Contendobacter sp.]